MKAIGKNIVVERIKEEITTESGMLLSAAEAEDFRYQKARVLNPGSEVSSVKSGDIVYYDKSRSFTLALEGVQCTVVQESAIIVVVGE